MRKNILIKNIFLVLFCIAALSVEVTAQDSNTLTIGDPAPEIQYSAWLQGTPVTSYEDDHVYVIEFWATWCGPCRAVMPHLSEMAEKYEDEATFIGVNIWEKTGDKPYESALPNVKRFVEASADRMRYNVAVDNNNQHMANNWMIAAGQRGIPSTFVIKEGRIVWIGHPMSLDDIIDPVIAGTFDVDAFKERYEKRAIGSAARRKVREDVLNAVKEAEEAGDFELAFERIDKGVLEIPILGFSLRMEKFKILLEHFSEEEALEYAEELEEEHDSYKALTASTIIELEGLSQNTYLYAARSFEEKAKEAEYSLYYIYIARAYKKAGDLEAAVEAQQKVVDLAKKEVKDPGFEGRVFEYTVEEYEKTLESLQKELENSK